MGAVARADRPPSVAAAVVEVPGHAGCDTSGPEASEQRGLRRNARPAGPWRRVPRRLAALAAGRRPLPSIERSGRPDGLVRAGRPAWMLPPARAAAADHVLEPLALRLGQVRPAAVKPLIALHEVG